MCYSRCAYIKTNRNICHVARHLLVENKYVICTRPPEEILERFNIDQE